MSESLRILILEDNPADAELVQFELRGAGVAFTSKVVVTEKDFVHELQDSPPDLILSDYDLPRYSGVSALAEARRRCPDTPFILVTAAVSEDRAIEILTQGAKDYVLKSRLQQRLVPAVQRALAEAEEHRARKQAEQELREAHRTLEEKVKIRTAALEAEGAARKKAEEERERLLAAAEKQTAELDATISSLAIGLIVYNMAGKAVRTNHIVEKLFPPGIFFNTTVEERLRVVRWKTARGQPFPLEELPVARALRGETTQNVVIGAPFPDRTVWISASAAPIRTPDGQMLGAVSSFIDITESKAAQDALQDSEQRYRQLFESAKDGIMILDAETGKVVNVNPYLLHLLGYSQDELCGQPIWELAAFKDIAASRDAFKTLHDNEYIRYDDLPLETRDGRPLVVEFVSNVYLVDRHKVIQCNIRDITERKRTEEALHHSEERYRALFNSMTEGFAIHEIITDAQDTPVDWRFLDINPAFERLTGLKRADVVGKTHNEVLPGDDPKWLSLYGAVALTGKPAQFENYSPALKRHYEVLAYCPAPREFAVLFMDITERKRAEEKIEESKRMLDALMEYVPEGITIADAPEVVTRMSSRYGDEMLLTGWDSSCGLTMEDWLARVDHYLSDGTSPAKPEELPLWKAVKKGEIIEGQELILRKPTGELITVLCNAGPIKDKDGDVTGGVVAWRNISKIKESQETLREALEESERNRAFLEAIFTAQNDAVVIYDREMHVQRVNPTFMEVYGFNPLGLHVKGIMQRVSCRSLDGRPLVFEEQPTPRALDGEQVVGRRFLVMRADGSEGIVDVSSGPIQLGNCIIGSVTVWHDITEQQKGEDALRESEESFRTLAENLPDQIMRFDRNLRLLYANPAVLQQIGLPRETIVGRTAHEYGAAPTAATRWERAACDVLESGKPWRYEHASHWQGETRILDTQIVPEQDANGAVRGLITIAHDITEIKHAEEALKEKTRLLEDANMELESFSYSVSHDLMAPIRAIDGFSRKLVKKCGDKLDDDTMRIINIIINNAERMGFLVNDLLSFSRLLQTGLSISGIDMDKMANEVWDDIRAAHEERDLEVDIKKLLPGLGDRKLIRQVLFNLFSNAVKFTKHRKPGIIEMSSYTESDEVVYRLKDNGVGFDMAYYDKLFGVFQRLHSREEYNGTGVGLAIVQRIIHRHGGRVWAEAKVNEGAIFYFSLPSKHD